MLKENEGHGFRSEENQFKFTHSLRDQARRDRPTCDATALAVTRYVDLAAQPLPSVRESDVLCASALPYVTDTRSRQRPFVQHFGDTAENLTYGSSTMK